MDKVGIVVPCYNYGRYLRECVQSILSQDVDLRVLIIDDASTDDTPQVSAALAAEDHRVEIRRHPVNRGHIATYNEGLEWAAGEYLLLISADDLLTPGALRRATIFLDSHPEAGFVYGKVMRWPEDQPRPVLQSSEESAGSEIMPGAEWVEMTLRRGFQITSPEVMVRTWLQKKLGGYSPELPEWADQDMWMRFAGHGKVGRIEEYQAYYRIHGANMHMQGGDLNRHYRGIRDYNQRIKLYDRIFSTYLGTSARTEELRSGILRQLAEGAVWDASAEIERDRVESSREYLRLARQAYPEISRWRPYLRTKCKIVMGARARLILLPIWDRVRGLRRGG